MRIRIRNTNETVILCEKRSRFAKNLGEIEKKGDKKRKHKKK